MAGRTVDWLVQEVHDLLDVSSVGLYEFIELLTDPSWPMPAERRVEVAGQALRRLLDEQGVELRWMRWPSFEDQGAVTLADLPTDPWGFDEDGRYLAITRA